MGAGRFHVPARRLGRGQPQHHQGRAVRHLGDPGGARRLLPQGARGRGGPRDRPRGDLRLRLRPHGQGRADAPEGRLGPAVQRRCGRSDPARPVRADDGRRRAGRARLADVPGEHRAARRRRVPVQPDRGPRRRAHQARIARARPPGRPRAARPAQERRRSAAAARRAARRRGRPARGCEPARLLQSARRRPRHPAPGGHRAPRRGERPAPHRQRPRRLDRRRQARHDRRGRAPVRHGRLDRRGRDLRGLRLGARPVLLPPRRLREVPQRGHPEARRRPGELHQPGRRQRQGHRAGARRHR